MIPLKQGYKDSNLEMTESESVALPFGDSPSTRIDYTGSISNLQAFFQKNMIFSFKKEPRITRAPKY